MKKPDVIVARVFVRIDGCFTYSTEALSAEALGTWLWDLFKQFETNPGTLIETKLTWTRELYSDKFPEYTQ